MAAARSAGGRRRVRCRPRGAQGRGAPVRLSARATIRPALTGHRHHLGATFIHLALSSPRLQTRRTAVETLKAVVKAAPKAGSAMLREALARRRTGDGKRYEVILGASVPDAATEEELKEALVVELVVLAHDPGICAWNPAALWLADSLLHFQAASRRCGRTSSCARAWIRGSWRRSTSSDSSRWFWTPVR